LIVSRGLLQSPHVLECSARVFTERFRLGVVVGKNQGVEHRFGSAGFGGFVVVPLVAVVGSNLLPQLDTLRDIFDQFPFAV
jgi:hypothetical protein